MNGIKSILSFEFFDSAISTSYMFECLGWRAVHVEANPTAYAKCVCPPCLSPHATGACLHGCMGARVRACVHACVLTCVRACMRA